MLEDEYIGTREKQLEKATEVFPRLLSQDETELLRELAENRLETSGWKTEDLWLIQEKIYAEFLKRAKGKLKIAFLKDKG